MARSGDLTDILTVSDIARSGIIKLLARYGIDLEWLPPNTEITGSFWGAPEAGVVGQRVFVRADTPVHSLLHETSHIVCMPADRRATLNRNAGGDDLEETAVCYLQIVLGDCLPGVGARRVMDDMDTWGYSFRLSQTAEWFSKDAEDASGWLREKGLLTLSGEPVFHLRDS